VAIACGDAISALSRSVNLSNLWQAFGLLQRHYSK
jgi:hypothetical protein